MNEELGAMLFIWVAAASTLYWLSRFRRTGS